MRIGIATCSEIPELTAGDQLFVASLQKLGVDARPIIWTDPDSLKENWDAIVVRNTWDYHKNAEAFFNWLAAAERKSIKVLNDLSVIRWNLDKNYLSELEAKGVACPPSLLIGKDTSWEKILNELREKGWTDIVVKPTISAGAFSHVPLPDK